MSSQHEKDQLEGTTKNIDLLPEQIKYSDEGCHVYPHCLTCPLPHCIYDAPHGRRAMLKETRNRELLKVYYKEGLNIETLAQRFGITERSVYRIISENREDKGWPKSINKEKP